MKGMEDVEPGEEERRENRRSQVSTLTLERLLQAGGGVRGRPGRRRYGLCLR